MAKENKGLNIKVLNTTHVNPRKQLGRKVCDLTIFDLFHLTFPYNKQMFVYKFGFSSLEFDNILDKLKGSLGIVLDDFYQLAGKLWKDEDGNYQVVYEDGMQGVEVVVATAEEIQTADLTSGKGLMELLPCDGFICLDGLRQPLLAVQVTKLNDGLVMGFAFNHAVLDGSSIWQFISSWAQICIGSKTISAHPFSDRTKVQKSTIKLNFTPRSTEGDVATGEMEPTEQRIIKSRIFNFSESAIDRIKSKVNADHSRSFSTFQCFAAHVWRSVTRARRINPDVKTFVALVADCRKRVDPPMPENYFGNIIQTIYTVADAGLLLGNPLEFVAAMIQEAIEMHDSEAIHKRNMEWESNPIVYRSGGKMIDNCVVFGGSPRFKVYEVDFGWGKPENVRSVGENIFDGNVYLNQGKYGGKSIDMKISLEANAMDNLEKDMEFFMEDNVLENLQKDKAY